MDRYRAAGAPDVFRLCHHDSVEAALRELYQKEISCRIAHCLLLEGHGVFALSTDLAVYVARPLPPAAHLMERRTVEVGRLDVTEFLDQPAVELLEADDVTEAEAAEAEAEEAAVEDVEEVEEVVEEVEEVEEVVEEVVVETPVTPEKLAEITGLDLESAALFLDVAEHGVPIRCQRWFLHPDYVGIERAHVVVIDARDENERAAASILAREVQRIRTDPQISFDLGSRMRRSQRVGIYIGDLSDSRDLGIKKALARIKKALPPAEGWDDWDDDY
ncbi:MAG: hypothetical protein V2A73_04860 [Pseudomonadota bacterium]